MGEPIVTSQGFIAFKEHSGASRSLLTYLRYPVLVNSGLLPRDPGDLKRTK
jgi:hypothetical protein